MFPSICGLWHHTGSHTWVQICHLFSKQCFLLSSFALLTHSFPWHAVQHKAFLWAGRAAVIPQSLLWATCYCWQALSEWCNPGQILRHHPDARYCVGSCCLLQCVWLLNFFWIWNLIRACPSDSWFFCWRALKSLCLASVESSCPSSCMFQLG